TRDGMVLPLLAGCLALTLLAATLLTVFTARQATINLRPPGPRTGQATSSRLGAPLLNAMVYSGGQPMMLGSLPGAVLVLALIPPRCRCLSDLRELTVQAPPANIYLVGVRGERVEGWTRPLGLGAAHAVDDADYALPPRYQVTALTAVLVRRDGTGLHVIPDRHGFQIRDDVLALVPPGQPALVPATRKPATPGRAGAPPAWRPGGGGPGGPWPPRCGADTLCRDAGVPVRARGEHTVIRSRRGVLSLRGLAAVAAAGLIPVIAGCEAGNNAP